ncbi:MAG: 4-hydroxybenzoate octaprenyltransferase [Alphaproteobacteria bacterium]|nr:4-hydroxybenzoate octaprenyltransferase [Alphaproteobacteria bacterium]
MSNFLSPSESDIARRHWTLRLSPRAWHPYLVIARADRPIGTWLLLLPCWISAALATQAVSPDGAVGDPIGVWPDPAILGLFAVGAFVMRGAGCTVNDLADRDIDGKVARTADRPLPSGAITPKQALVFLAAQLLIGLLVLLSLPPATWLIAIASLTLVAAYPFMKRITYWPQAWLGLTFNWGALVGWAAVTGEIGWPAVLLYAAGIFWTLGYDTLYAHQDKADDLIAGVKSSAIALGDRTKPAVTVFYAGAVLLTGLAFEQVGTGVLAYAALAAGAVQLAWQIRYVDIDDPTRCMTAFRSNRVFGLILVAGLIADGGLALG